MGSVTTTPKALRADAQRNYDALLAAGKSIFARFGVDAPFEDVAREAGVGRGTRGPRGDKSAPQAARRAQRGRLDQARAERVAPSRSPKTVPRRPDVVSRASAVAAICSAARRSVAI